MRKLLAVFVAAGLIQLFGGADMAQAQYPGMGWNYFGGWTYPFYVQERVPYYSAHPPVYYSTPVSRSYGHSPFPYTSMQGRPPATPMVVYANPYMAALPQTTTSAPIERPQPVVIKNPFVQ